MAKQSQRSSNGAKGATQALALPSIEELRKVYEEGIPQPLLSGIEVRMRPVTPDRLLQLGRVPDILTPIMLKGLYEQIQTDLDEFLTKQRDDKEETLEMLRTVDIVCEAALIDPSIIPYLSLSDRMWIFRLAFMPAEVLSRFRRQPRRNVEVVDDERKDEQPTEPITESVEQPSSVPA